MAIAKIFGIERGASGFERGGKVRSPAIRISILFPSSRSSASTTVAGNRTARLLPHFDTCIGPPRYTYLLDILTDLRATQGRGGDEVEACSLRHGKRGPKRSLQI